MECPLGIPYGIRELLDTHSSANFDFQKTEKILVMDQARATGEFPFVCTYLSWEGIPGGFVPKTKAPAQNMFTSASCNALMTEEIQFIFHSSF